MRSLLERHVTAADRFILVAPPGREVPPNFHNVRGDASQHHAYVRELQRFRGEIYLRDGAIRSLPSDGRHETPEDYRSWHVLRLDEQGRISACIWYLEHDGPMSIDRLRVSDCPLNEHIDWRQHLHGAVASEFGRASAEGLPYAEVGGWAVASDRRCSVEGILLALSAFSLGRIFGGAMVMATATARHASASILRRLGGSLLECEGKALPAYFDPRYDCEMELLRFDTRRASSRYDHLVQVLTDSLSRVSVVTSSMVSEKSEASVAA